MSKLRVFLDTGALLSMVVFPVGRKGKTTLAGETLSLYQEEVLEIVVSQEVMEELLEVVRAEFPDAYEQALLTYRN